jgi:hypothetical protein
MLRRITGSVPKKLLSVAEYSSPSMGDKRVSQARHVDIHQPRARPSPRELALPISGVVTHLQGGQCGP